MVEEGEESKRRDKGKAKRGKKEKKREETMRNGLERRRVGGRIGK